MIRTLIDSNDTVIYQGVDAKELMKVLLLEPCDVTEEHELRWETKLRELYWFGELRYEIHFNLKFKGIDDWNRAVFKDLDSSLYFGSVNKLFDDDAPKEDILKYFKENLNDLEYFGDSFGCEPHGGRQDFFKFNIVE